jgi:hypothetical protein
MAEVLAAPAAFAAVLQLSVYGMRLTTGLYKFAQDAGAAKKDIKHFANRLQLFSATIVLAKNALDDYCRDNPQSSVVIYMEHYGVLRNVKRTSNQLYQRLTHADSSLEAMKGRWLPVMTLMWIFKKSSIMDLFPGMDGLQASLTLLVQVASLETNEQTLNILRKERGAIGSEAGNANLDKLREERCVPSEALFRNIRMY